MMPVSRRLFLQRCTTALAAIPVLTPDGLRAQPLKVPRWSVKADPETVKQLALRAVDAVKAAGAEYADVRLIRNVRHLQWDEEEISVGVRALVKGAWGFAASAVWTPDEMRALAESAVVQARANSGGVREPVALGTVPVASGQWDTPLEIDPFTVPVEEKNDFLAAFGARCAFYKRGYTSMGPFTWIGRKRSERAVATTEGAFVTQTLTQTPANLTLMVKKQPTDQGGLVLPLRRIQPAGRGWELLRDANILDQIGTLCAWGEELHSLPTKPFEIGRYDVVFDSPSMAAMISETLGTATELDRALGFEANAGGTSFLGPRPLNLLGSLQVGSSALTLTADRSMPGGVATVKWDDEGITPTQATLIKNGALTDYQTTRAQAAWLSPWYEKRGTPVQSHGYASSESALFAPVQHRPNLALAPAAANVGVNDLISQVKKGLMVYFAKAHVDFQAKNGFISSTFCVREIVNGKLGAIVIGGGVLFNSIELWKSLVAVGGAASAETWDIGTTKGQPRQSMNHSVSAVPALFKNLTYIDLTRTS